MLGTVTMGHGRIWTSSCCPRQRWLWTAGRHRMLRASKVLELTGMSDLKIMPAIGGTSGRGIGHGSGSYRGSPICAESNPTGDREQRLLYPLILEVEEFDIFTRVLRGDPMAAITDGRPLSNRTHRNYIGGMSTVILSMSTRLSLMPFPMSVEQRTQ